MEFEIKTTIPFTSASEMKYSHICLTKYVQDLHEENYKSLMEEMERHFMFGDRKV